MYSQPSIVYPLPMSSGTIRALQLEPSKGCIRAPTAAFRAVGVDGVSGHICDVKLEGADSAKNLMLKIMQETGVNWCEQTLVVGTRVLGPSDPVRANNVVMVRRNMTYERYHWMKMIKRCPSAQLPFYLLEDKEFMLTAASFAPHLVAECIPKKFHDCTELGVLLVQNSGLVLERLPESMRSCGRRSCGRR